MNATTIVEGNVKPQERCTSDDYHHRILSNNSDNPLMKLVDAALAPEVNNCHNNDVGARINIVQAAARVEDHNPTDVDARKEASKNNTASTGSTTTRTTTGDASINITSPLQEGQEAKVIRGTVEDLVSRQDKKLTFAEYLMQCLNDEANHDVLQWMPCGTQFTITNHRKFTMERMPSLFKIRNMSSFVRKLTRWGFNRVHEKETGNSDIFKHPLFIRDKPELCKKIRCVNRASQQQQQHHHQHQQQAIMYHHPHLQQHPPPPHHHHHYQKPHMVHMMHHPGSDNMMMGNLSESSSMRGSIPPGGDTMHMISPRRSMGGSGPHYVHSNSGGRGVQPPMHNGPPPPPYNLSSSRFPPPQLQQTPGPPPGGRHHPRVSPEYEKEMIAGGSFPSRPPQVYSPPSIGRSMSAAAEYELEQVLLERQRARAAMYREQQQQHQQVVPRQGGSPIMMMGNGSERSLGTIATGISTGNRYPTNNHPTSPNNNNDNSPSPNGLTNTTTTSSVVTAALETLQREGEYELDMSPREAMLRAVLHKRQQQRNQQQQQQQRGGPPPPPSSSRYDGPPPPPPVHYYR